MQTIHELSENLIAKIAAGEVVERPAYAIKELLDNSIDAHATEIFIDIEDAGFTKIAVTDNGIGMSQEDVRESFKPHTTSKISTDADLHSIKSFGFRGEALWSITAISDLTIKSRPLDQETGTIAELRTGELESFTRIGMPFGTSIEVRNLFNSVPARKKFMRSSLTEYRHIFDMVISFILAFPQIGFIFKHNNKTIFNFVKDQTLEERIASIFGVEISPLLIPVNHEHEYAIVSGFMTKPQAALNTSLKQFIFVNNRRIFDKIIASTIKTSYGTLLEPKVHPAFILFLTIPHERIDINIHPRKEQVAFADTALISKAVADAVTKTLAEKNLTYQDMRWKKGEYAQNHYESFSLREGYTESYAGKLLKETTDAWTVNDTHILKSSDIVQIHNTFIISQTKNGIIMIDQHAAHERILYEQFREQFEKEKSKIDKYNLSNPLKLNLGSLGALLIGQHLSELRNVGFSLEPTGESEYTISSIPIIYKDKNISQILFELIEDLTQSESMMKLDTQSNKMLSFLACRTAIKAGDRLTKDQAKNLIEKLQQTKTQYTCPHGRPVQVELSLRELYRLFHRV